MTDLACRRRVPARLRRRLLPLSLALAGLTGLAGLAGLAGCARRPAAPAAAAQLVDVFRPRMVTPRPVPARQEVGTVWRCGQGVAGAGPEPATCGWEAGPGVAGLAVRNGELVGQATTDFPMLHLATNPPARPDVMQALEVTLSVSQGKNLEVQFVPAEKVDLAAQLQRARAMPWRISTPLVPDGKPRTYVLASPYTTDSAETRHILLRPTDAAGASFAIQSVRLVLRREHLAAVPPGVSWQGLGEIYRETLVTRAPEVAHIPVDLPPRAWLDVAVGTPDEHALTFRITARPEDGAADAARLVLERTVTAPDHWEPLRVDLSRWAGRAVTLDLELAGAPRGTLGFWGAPVVRPALAAGDGGPPQGVILVVTDTLRRDHLDAYGYGRQTAPVLDELAREGALFRDCQTDSTWTKVAVPSLLTSLYPESHRVIDFGDRLPSTAHTIAEVYRQAGYATLSLSSAFFTGRMTNLHKGFEELHESASLTTRPASKTARQYVDRLLPWLERHRDVRFFVFLHLLDPHYPYETYPPYDRWWADPAKKAVYTAQLAAVRPLIAEPLLKMIGLPSRQELLAAGIDPVSFIRQDMDWYDGSIRSLDTEMGRLIGQLRRLGLDRRTVVAVVADHGEEFLDHGRMFHGQSVYGELSNVPLLLWAPGRIGAGTKVEATVENVDLMPTLLELSSLAPPREVQGKSLVPLLGGTAAAPRSGWSPRPAFTEKAAIHDVLGPPPRTTQSFAVVADGWKLIYNEKRQAGTAEYELYDHRRDPLDHADVAAQHPEVVRRLAQLVERWRRKTLAERLPSDREASRRLGNDELARLRSLGYIQ
jgi:arylsulfatase A-like enzyme